MEGEPGCLVGGWVDGDESAAAEESTVRGEGPSTADDIDSRACRGEGD